MIVLNSRGLLKKTMAATIYVPLKLTLGYRFCKKKLKQIGTAIIIIMTLYLSERH